MALETLLDPALLGPAAIVVLILVALYVTFSGFALVGIGVGETFVLLFLAPLVAGINLPVYSYDGTILAVNAAGLIIPLVLSWRFLSDGRAPLGRAFLGVSVVTWVAHRTAVYDPGRGILVPALLIAGVAMVVGVVLGGGTYRRWGPLTFISGSAGTLIGADLLNLPMIVSGPDAPEAAVIGGAGTLDAIYLCAVWAVAGSILAAVLGRVVAGQPR